MFKHNWLVVTLVGGLIFGDCIYREYRSGQEVRALVQRIDRMELVCLGEIQDLKEGLEPNSLDLAIKDLREGDDSRKEMAKSFLKKVSFEGLEAAVDRLSKVIFEIGKKQLATNYLTQTIALDIVTSPTIDSKSTFAVMKDQASKAVEASS